MKKKFTIIISVICLVCILMLATLSACSDNSSDEVFYNATSFGDYNQVSAGIKMQSNSPETIVSYKQLEKFCREANMQINDESDWVYASAVYKKFRSYDNNFFKNKVLIVLYIWKPYPQGLDFGNLKIKDDVMTINILNNHDPYSNSSHDDIEARYLFLIEINKNSIKDVKQIKVKEYNYLTKENKS